MNCIMTTQYSSIDDNKKRDYYSCRNNVLSASSMGGMGMQRLNLNPPMEQSFPFMDATTSSGPCSGNDMMKANKHLGAPTSNPGFSINSMGGNTSCLPLVVQQQGKSLSAPQAQMIPSGVIQIEQPLLEHKRRPPSSYRSTRRSPDDRVSFPKTYTLSPTDIMCGRHKRALNHAGNRRFRALIASYLPRYFEYPTRIDRAILALDIVEAVDDYRGYFLKQNKQTGVWTELSSKEKRDKVGHALRDAAAATTNNNASGAASSSGSVSSHASSTAIKQKKKATKKAAASKKRSLPDKHHKKTNSAPNLSELTKSNTSDETHSVPDSHTVSKYVRPDTARSGGVAPLEQHDELSDDELSSILGADDDIVKANNRQALIGQDLLDMDVFIDPFSTDEQPESVPSSSTTTTNAQHSAIGHLLQADFMEF